MQPGNKGLREKSQDGGYLTFSPSGEMALELVKSCRESRIQKHQPLWSRDKICIKNANQRKTLSFKEEGPRRVMMTQAGLKEMSFLLLTNTCLAPEQWISATCLIWRIAWGLVKTPGFQALPWRGWNSSPWHAIQLLNQASLVPLDKRESTSVNRFPTLLNQN